MPRNTVQADWQCPSIRNSSPVRLCSATTGSKRENCPPMPYPADLPAMADDVSSEKTSAQKYFMSLIPLLPSARLSIPQQSGFRRHPKIGRGSALRPAQHQPARTCLHLARNFRKPAAATATVEGRRTAGDRKHAQPDREEISAYCRGGRSPGSG